MLVSCVSSVAQRSWPHLWAACGRTRHRTRDPRGPVMVAGHDKAASSQLVAGSGDLIYYLCT